MSSLKSFLQRLQESILADILGVHRVPQLGERDRICRPKMAPYKGFEGRPVAAAGLLNQGCIRQITTPNSSHNLTTL